MKTHLDYSVYKDKLKACWAGKSIGGLIGAPVEAHKIKGDFTAENCWPDKMYPNDDLDLQIVFLEMLEKYGPVVDHQLLSDFWRETCWYNFAEYGFFLYNVQRGINPPLSGDFNNDYYSECEGCPIRSEIWGAISPGNARLAAKYAKTDGTLDHKGNSVHAEMFWAAAEAMAFVCDDIQKCLQYGLSVIPTHSDIAEIYRTTVRLWREFGDWNEIWFLLVRKYGHRENSKAEINFAFTVLALLASDGDMKKAIVTAINCGWDSDCTAATAAAFIGILKGMAGIPMDWYDRMGRNLNCDVNTYLKEASFDETASVTAKVGLKNSFILNKKVTFTNVDVEVGDLTTIRRTLAFSVDYNGDPSITPEAKKNVVLKIKNLTSLPFVDTLILTPDSQLLLDKDRLAVEIPPKRTLRIPLQIQYIDEELLRDKNLIQIKFENSIAEWTFGVCGAKRWKIYGPYFNAWDVRLYKECPYRNDEKIVHPVTVVGSELMMIHNHSFLEYPYLDENALVCKDLDCERPYVVYTATQHIDNHQINGFIGEHCNYLVREIVSQKDITCRMSIGCISPIKVWLDGKELGTHKETTCWGIWEEQYIVTFKAGEKHRIVIKTAQKTDWNRLSVHFIRHINPEDKSCGNSYIYDCVDEILTK